MTTRKTQLGQLLKSRREQMRYSRTRAATLSGVNASTIEAWELGRVGKPPIHDVMRLARVLSIPTSELEHSVLSESEEIETDTEQPATTRGSADVDPVGLALFNRAATRLGWTDADAASALNTSLEHISSLRRGEGELTVLEVMTLIAVLAAFPSGRGGASPSEVEALLRRLHDTRVP